jgi:putative PIN family toxin of toxin-antitoxin system
MHHRQRIVVDTNVLVSRLIVPGSIPARAFDIASQQGRLLVSNATLEELQRVLSKRKFEHYVTLGQRKHFLQLLSNSVEIVDINAKITACRDPKDDKFLELAVNGLADLIVSGDQDLLVLHPFMHIAIISPADYISRNWCH